MRCCTSQSHRSPLFLPQPASPACALPTEVCRHGSRTSSSPPISRARRSKPCSTPSPWRARAGPDSSPACPTRSGGAWHGGQAAGDRGPMVTRPRAPRLCPGAHPRRVGRSRRRDLPRGPGTPDGSDCDEYPWPHGQDLGTHRQRCGRRGAPSALCGAHLSGDSFEAARG